MPYLFDPNRNPFARRTFAETYRVELETHPLERLRLTPVFKAQNPKGYQHDLGAADVFLDNFGLLFKEQVEETVWREYERCVQGFLSRWSRLRGRVLTGRPWWGTHFNNPVHKAHAGRPQGLLRLLSDDELAWSGGDGDEAPQNPLLPVWPADGLMPEEGDFGSRPRIGLMPGGVLPEKPFAEFVEEVRLLPPREATPDLPSRVGMTKDDRRVYGEVARDQGELGTCAAHALSVALDVLVRRQQKALRLSSRFMHGLQFSPSWVHCSSGEDRATGRSIRAVVETVSETLPCFEKLFPYPLPREQSDWKTNKAPWNTDAIKADSRALTERLGPPEIVRLSCEHVARIKAYLAAGWVVVLGTKVTEQFLWSPGLQQDGLPLAPLPGHRRVDGHGWVLVGYDHVDGNHFWKYQGRFFGLSSWGPRYPARPLAGAGVFTLPFAMLLTEGMDAYAMRFRA